VEVGLAQAAVPVLVMPVGVAGAVGVVVVVVAGRHPA
jgi:hypothetical protein